jgi:hypothetical protein
MAAPAINSQKKGKPLDPTLADPHHNPYWKVNHKPRPSRLSNVQHIDEIPDPLNPGLAFYAEKFTDGNYSEEGERCPPASTKEREYDSAPESRPARRKTQPVRQNNHNRDSSTSEENSPPRSKGSRLQALQKTKTSPRGRRAYSEGLRNADGVRLTKKGTVDRRSGNYKYLKLYYEKLRTQKEGERRPGQEQGNGEGGEIMLSIEAETAAAQMQDEDRERLEAVKQAELEARDRLVRETLERELGA